MQKTLITTCLIFRKWRRDYLNDTSQNDFVDAYRDALNKAGFNPRNVLMSIPTKKFNKHSKVCYKIQTMYLTSEF